jgi:hypothetical protein
MVVFEHLLVVVAEWVLHLVVALVLRLARTLRVTLKLAAPGLALKLAALALALLFEALPSVLAGRVSKSSAFTPSTYTRRGTATARQEQRALWSRPSEGEGQLKDGARLDCAFRLATTSS